MMATAGDAPVARRLSSGSGLPMNPDRFPAEKSARGMPGSRGRTASFFCRTRRGTLSKQPNDENEINH